MTTCTGCGSSFTAPPRSGNGRPRSRCEACRGNLDRIDGARWRALRRQVLAGRPPCSVTGCSRLATQVDHIMPLAAGGDPYALSNLRPTCGPCNARKGARLPGGVPPIDNARRRCLCSDPDGHGCGNGLVSGPPNTPTAEMTPEEKRRRWVL